MDQVPHRAAAPQRRSNPQFFGALLIEQLLQVGGLLVIKDSAGAERSSGPLVGQRVEAALGIRAPPARNRLPGHAEQVCDLGLREVHLAAAQSPQPQRLQHFVGQLACVWQRDCHDTFLHPDTVKYHDFSEQLSCRGNIL